MLEEVTPGELLSAAVGAGQLLDLCYKLVEGGYGSEVLASAAIDAAMGRMTEAENVAREARSAS